MRKLTKFLALSVLLLANSSYPLSTSAQELSIPASGWSIAFIGKVDPGFYVHYSYTSIAVDSDNHAHVSYRGPDNDLRYATNETGCWLAEIVYDAAPEAIRPLTSIPVAQLTSATPAVAV